MPKPFTYRAVTANCGNDTLGTEASAQIAHLLIEGQGLDFIVINCQEVDFEKTRLQLELLVKEEGYSVKCLATMVTHTKPSTQFHSNTGIATYVLHKSDLTLQTESVIAVRRNGQRFSGSGYNKGGVVTDFTITRKEGAPEEERIKIQSISGHLDSNNSNKRNVDWANLHRASSKEKVESWDALVLACPTLNISGYDANTRDKLEWDYAINLLMDRPDAPEVQAFHRAPFADRHFSSEVTYSKLGKDSIEDSKRPGYAKQGMLDYVGIADGSEPKEMITTKHVINIGIEDSTERDHAVLISPPQEYSVAKPEFEVIKGQIASRLYHVAPKFAQEIRHLSDDEQSKHQLVSIYNIYLSTNGLLNKAIALQTPKLELLNRFVGAEFITSDEVKQQLADTLFKNTNWCEGSPETLVTKQHLTQVLIESLSCCQHEPGIKARLNWYCELEAKINENPLLDPVHEFKERTIAKYIEARGKFVNALQNYEHRDEPLRKNFQEAGANVLAHLDSIVTPDPEVMSQQYVGIKSLDRLTRIAGACQRACEEIHSRKDLIPQITRELGALSQEYAGRASALWNALSSALNAFIQAVAAIVGIIPKTLNIVSKGGRLANSISDYKSVLQDLHTVPAASNSSQEEPEVVRDEEQKSPANL